MSRKQFIMLLGIGGVALLLIIIMLGSLIPDREPETVTVTRQGVPVATLETKATDPVLGKSNAPVTVFVFSDFGCDHCASVVPVLKELVKKHDNVRVVWKDAPVTQFPAPSAPAHLAARCAARQNKFWEYHDKLFEQQTQLTEATFLNIAQELKLKEEPFKSCLAEKKLQPLVDANLALAQSLGIDGTPYFFIDDERFSGSRTLEFLEDAVKRAAL
ncbi:MAG: thioredoxin domain-containing protein [Patescibacteria group bacterium]